MLRGVLLVGCSDVDVEVGWTSYLGRRRRKGGRILLLLAFSVGGMNWVGLDCFVRFTRW